MEFGKKLARIIAGCVVLLFTASCGGDDDKPSRWENDDFAGRIYSNKIAASEDGYINYTTLVFYKDGNAEEYVRNIKTDELKFEYPSWFNIIDDHIAIGHNSSPTPKQLDIIDDGNTLINTNVKAERYLLVSTGGSTSFPGSGGSSGNAGSGGGSGNGSSSSSTGITVSAVSGPGEINFVIVVKSGKVEPSSVVLEYRTSGVALENPALTSSREARFAGNPGSTWQYKTFVSCSKDGYVYYRAKAVVGGKTLQTNIDYSRPR